MSGRPDTLGLIPLDHEHVWHSWRTATTNWRCWVCPAVSLSEPKPNQFEDPFLAEQQRREYQLLIRLTASPRRRDRAEVGDVR